MTLEACEVLSDESDHTIEHLSKALDDRHTERVKSRERSRAKATAESHQLANERVAPIGENLGTKCENIPMYNVTKIRSLSKRQ